MDGFECVRNECRRCYIDGIDYRCGSDVYSPDFEDIEGYDAGYRLDDEDGGDDDANGDDDDDVGDGQSPFSGVFEFDFPSPVAIIGIVGVFFVSILSTVLLWKCYVRRRLARLKTYVS